MRLEPSVVKVLKTVTPAVAALPASTAELCVKATARSPGDLKIAITAEHLYGAIALATGTPTTVLASNDRCDALTCPGCGAAMVLLAFLTNPPVVRRILEHLDLPSAAPRLSPARASDDPADSWTGDHDEPFNNRPGC